MQHGEDYIMGYKTALCIQNPERATHYQLMGTLSDA